MPDKPHFLLAESPGRERGCCFCLDSGTCTQAVGQRNQQGMVAMGSYRINRQETRGTWHAKDICTGARSAPGQQAGGPGRQPGKSHAVIITLALLPSHAPCESGWASRFPSLSLSLLFCFTAYSQNLCLVSPSIYLLSRKCPGLGENSKISLPALSPPRAA